MSDELKHCPFCGSDNLDHDLRLDGKTPDTYVLCKDCDGCMEGNQPDENVKEKWNKRYTEEGKLIVYSKAQVDNQKKHIEIFIYSGRRENEVNHDELVDAVSKQYDTSKYEGATFFVYWKDGWNEDDIEEGAHAEDGRQ